MCDTGISAEEQVDKKAKSNVKKRDIEKLTSTDETHEVNEQTSAEHPSAPKKQKQTEKTSATLSQGMFDQKNPSSHPSALSPILSEDEDVEIDLDSSNEHNNRFD